MVNFCIKHQLAYQIIKFIRVLEHVCSYLSDEPLPPLSTEPPRGPDTNGKHEEYWNAWREDFRHALFGQ